MLISCRDAGRSFPLGVALFSAVWPGADRAGTEFQPGRAHSAVLSDLPSSSGNGLGLLLLLLGLLAG